MEFAARESLHLNHLQRNQADEFDALEGGALVVALRSSHGGSSVSSEGSKHAHKQSSIRLYNTSPCINATAYITR